MSYMIGAGSGIGAGFDAGFGATGPGLVFDPGALAARAGPDPEAVAMAAQRLASLARDVDSVRQGLGSVDTQQWRSPAASVFRDALAGLLTELWAAAQALDSACAALARYCLALQSSNEAQAGANPVPGPTPMGWEP